MPLYEYDCDACGQRFEVIRKFSDPPLEVCARCGKGPLRRLPSSPAIQFKGSGWYITDYAQKGKTGQSDSESKATGETKSESKATGETKTESTTSADAGTKTDTSKAPAPAPAAKD